MEKLVDIETALTIFEQAAVEHALATEQGDYKLANQSYSAITKSITFLKEQDVLTRLVKLLDHQSIGVRMWAAASLLPIKEADAITALEKISKEQGIHSLTAEMTLNEWKEGGSSILDRFNMNGIKSKRRF